jgi:hypothetical protein
LARLRNKAKKRDIPEAKGHLFYYGKNFSKSARSAQAKIFNPEDKPLFSLWS